jgi:hypothetical protein
LLAFLLPVPSSKVRKGRPPSLLARSRRWQHGFVVRDLSFCRCRGLKCQPTTAQGRCWEGQSRISNSHQSVSPRTIEEDRRSIYGRRGRRGARQVRGWSCTVPVTLKR